MIFIPLFFSFLNESNGWVCIAHNWNFNSMQIYLNYSNKTILQWWYWDENVIFHWLSIIAAFFCVDYYVSENVFRKFVIGTNIFQNLTQHQIVLLIGTQFFFSPLSHPPDQSLFNRNRDNIIWIKSMSNAISMCSCSNNSQHIFTIHNLIT